jgi:hypothetical protein
MAIYMPLCILIFYSEYGANFKYSYFILMLEIHKIASFSAPTFKSKKKKHMSKVNTHNLISGLLILKESCTISQY